MKCVHADLESTTNRQEDSCFPDIREFARKLRAEEVKLGCHDVSYGVGVLELKLLPHVCFSHSAENSKLTNLQTCQILLNYCRLIRTFICQETRDVHIKLPFRVAKNACSLEQTSGSQQYYEPPQGETRTKNVVPVNHLSQHRDLPRCIQTGGRGLVVIMDYTVIAICIREEEGYSAFTVRVSDSKGYLFGQKWYIKG